MNITPETNYPCEFTLKVLGKNNAEFEQKAIMITREFFPDLKENAISQRLSKDKNYLSLSISVTATSREQLDKVYQAYTAAPEIVAAL
jgi:putative lipoic acid-binding regulatory protein